MKIAPRTILSAPLALALNFSLISRISCHSLSIMALFGGSWLSTSKSIGSSTAPIGVALTFPEEELLSTSQEIHALMGPAFMAVEAPWGVNGRVKVKVQVFSLPDSSPWSVKVMESSEINGDLLGS